LLLRTSIVSCLCFSPSRSRSYTLFVSFFFTVTSTSVIYTLSLHDALPIYFAGPSLGPPFHLPFQLNHFPFGSVPHSIRIGPPKSFAARAQARRSRSKSPATILSSVKTFSECS